ncbi:unnamed protein product [Mytilus edulis]|uniref:Uncharacterized protein n=1 Tax=Mytilus edulis TaxID=6550 RepID=A0A8S3TNH8_MYTED|nr:unnamed protein product [Mytilus edulis]
MYRVALILLIVYSVVQVYGRESSQLPVDKEDNSLLNLKERLYDLMLEDREINSCGIQDAYLNCANINFCQSHNNICPSGQHCCSTTLCGNICLCKPTPDNCPIYCTYGYMDIRRDSIIKGTEGYKTGSDGCYTCDCNQISMYPFLKDLKRLLRRILDKKEKQPTQEETE